ncbi:MAG: serine/threonine protein kinase [Myxococcales bacterium]|nr:serine/threonine protein kinase [Myxococcales bacterium]
MSAAPNGGAAPRSGGRSSFDPADLIGRVFGDRYRIESVVGKGGMSVVFRAEDMKGNRTVALKVLNGAGGDDERQALRFKQEARASSRLTHPSIIRVYDYGQTADGLLFMSMELLVGRTLGQLVKQAGPLSPERASRIVMSACSALAEAHRLGIIHRDLKPDNIFVVREARGDGSEDAVKLLDFGIAKVVGEGSYETLTQTGFICGTPLYISPEQSLGQELDGRSDLYSCGVILYELLTGKTPFTADTPIALVMKHIHNEPPALEVQNPSVNVPDGLRQVVFRLLHKDRNKRPRSSQEVVEQLQRLLPACAGLRAASRPEGVLAVATASSTPSAMVSPEPAPEPPRAASARPSAPGLRSKSSLASVPAIKTAAMPTLAVPVDDEHDSTRVLDVRSVDTSPVDTGRRRAKAPPPKSGNGLLWASVGVAVLVGAGIVALFSQLEGQPEPATVPVPAPASAPARAEAPTLPEPASAHSARAEAAPSVAMVAAPAESVAMDANVAGGAVVAAEAPPVAVAPASAPVAVAPGSPPGEVAPSAPAPAEVLSPAIVPSAVVIEAAPTELDEASRPRYEIVTALSPAQKPKVKRPKTVQWKE